MPAAGTPWWGTRRSALTWLLLAAATCAALLVVLYLGFVHTTRGQWVDDAALRGTRIGRRHILSPARNILDLVSVTSLGLATIALGVVAFLRRRPVLALLAMTLVAGSNITTEVLKHVIFTRPSLDPSDPLPYITFPSGHTTVALSVGVALALVSPPASRGVVAVIGAVYGAATGVATMTAGWHRPSDAVAGCLVVATWTALIGAAAVLVPALLGRELPEPDGDDTAYTVAVTLFSITAMILLAAGTLALIVTAFSVPQPGSRPRLFLAYAGGASTVAAAALAAMTGMVIVAKRCRTDELDRGSPAADRPEQPLIRRSAD